MKEYEYSELPWSMEQTIENLKELKKALQIICINQDIDGKGKEDEECIAFDFDRAVEALEKQIPKKVLKIQGDKLKFGTCPCCERRISTVEGGNYCQNCGNAIDWSVEDGSS